MCISYSDPRPVSSRSVRRIVWCNNWASSVRSRRTVLCLFALVLGSDPPGLRLHKSHPGPLPPLRVLLIGLRHPIAVSTGNTFHSPYLPDAEISNLIQNEHPVVERKLMMKTWLTEPYFAVLECLDRSAQGVHYCPALSIGVSNTEVLHVGSFVGRCGRCETMLGMLIGRVSALAAACLALSI